MGLTHFYLTNISAWSLFLFLFEGVCDFCPMLFIGARTLVIMTTRTYASRKNDQCRLRRRCFFFFWSVGHYTRKQNEEEKRRKTLLFAPSCNCKQMTHQNLSHRWRNRALGRSACLHMTEVIRRHANKLNVFIDTSGFMIKSKTLLLTTESSEYKCRQRIRVEILMPTNIQKITDTFITNKSLVLLVFILVKWRWIVLVIITRFT